MKNSLLVIFDEIWLMTLYYYSPWSLAQFLKNHLQNLILIKSSTQHTNMYTSQKCNKNREFTPSHF